MTTFDRLQQKIKNQLGIYAYDFKRNRPGKWMRFAGAFVWEAKINDIFTIGSCYTATELVKCSNIVAVKQEFGEIEVFPDSLIL